MHQETPTSSYPPYAPPGPAATPGQAGAHTQGSMNPYAPPSSGPYGNPPPIVHAEDDFIDATRGQRLGTYIVDRIFHMLVMFLVAMGIMIPLEVAGINTDPVWDQRFTGYILGAIAAMMYFVPQELIAGRSLGKLIFGTKVVRASDGGPPSLGAICIRTLSRLVPFEPFSIFSSTGLWHDQWSKTRVISVRHGGRLGGD